ncbi:hypothetical protein ACWEP4_40465 [Streptomyces sp. NPDC004227]
MTAQPTPADELRAAAEKLRETAPDITGRLAGLADPVAEWLEHEAELAKTAHLWAERESCAWCGEPANAHALAVARAINA